MPVKSFCRGEPVFWQNPTAKRRGPSLAVRVDHWKLLMEYDGTDVQLFDLNTDAAESHNIASDHSELVDQLRTQLGDWYRSLPPLIDRVYVESP